MAVLAEADERVVGEVVGHVLIDHPRHAGLLQPLGIGDPVIAPVRMSVSEYSASHALFHHHLAGRPRGAVRAGPVEEAVGIGAPVQRAEICIAYGEGVGQRELERGFGLRVVTHGLWLLVARPFGHAAAVPGVARILPAVGRAVHALGVAGGLVQVVGQYGLAVLVGLLPDAAPARQGNGEAVAEAAHADERAEVVVERAVFLHEYDDVLDVLDRAGAPVGGNGQGAADAGREQTQRRGTGRGAGGGLQELALGGVKGHGVTWRKMGRTGAARSGRAAHDGIFAAKRLNSAVPSRAARHGRDDGLGGQQGELEPHVFPSRVSPMTRPPIGVARRNVPAIAGCRAPKAKGAAMLLPFRGVGGRVRPGPSCGSGGRTRPAPPSRPRRPR